MGILKRHYLEKQGVFDAPSDRCPSCGHISDDPGDECYACRFDEMMEDEPYAKRIEEANK